MSNIEFKAPRPMSEIQQDYNNAAAQLGDSRYKIMLEEEKSKNLQDHMRKLSQEGAAAQKDMQEVELRKSLEEKKLADAEKEKAETNPPQESA